MEFLPHSYILKSERTACHQTIQLCYCFCMVSTIEGSDAVIKAWLVVTEVTIKKALLAVENAHHLLLNFL